MYEVDFTGWTRAPEELDRYIYTYTQLTFGKFLYKLYTLPQLKRKLWETSAKCLKSIL